MRGTFKELLRAQSEVFARASYAALGCALAILAFLLAVWLPNLALIAQIFSSSRAPFIDKLAILVSLTGGIATNFNLLSASYTIATAILFGMNGAMIIYLLKRRGRDLEKRAVAAGTLGIVSGTLGVGCAACGSLLLTPLLFSVGVGGALAILPLHGGEFGILGVGLLLLSLVIIAKKIASPLLCNTAPPPL